MNVNDTVYIKTRRNYMTGTVTKLYPSGQIGVTTQYGAAERFTPNGTCIGSNGWTHFIPKERYDHGVAVAITEQGKRDMRLVLSQLAEVRVDDKALVLARLREALAFAEINLRQEEAK